MWCSQAQQQAEQIQKAAEGRKAKALAEAQAEASATLASAAKAAAATLREAEATVAQMAQQQEAQALQAAEATKQQVAFHTPVLHVLSKQLQFLHAEEFPSAQYAMQLSALLAWCCTHTSACTHAPTASFYPHSS